MIEQNANKGSGENEDDDEDGAGEEDILGVAVDDADERGTNDGFEEEE